MVVDQSQLVVAGGVGGVQAHADVGDVRLSGVLRIESEVAGVQVSDPRAADVGRTLDEPSSGSVLLNVQVLVDESSEEGNGQVSEIKPAGHGVHGDDGGGSAGVVVHHNSHDVAEVEDTAGVGVVGLVEELHEVSNTSDSLVVSSGEVAKDTAAVDDVAVVLESLVGSVGSVESRGVEGLPCLVGAVGGNVLNGGIAVLEAVLSGVVAQDPSGVVGSGGVGTVRIGIVRSVAELSEIGTVVIDGVVVGQGRTIGESAVGRVGLSGVGEVVDKIARVGLVVVHLSVSGLGAVAVVVPSQVLGSVRDDAGLVAVLDDVADGGVDSRRDGDVAVAGGVRDIAAGPLGVVGDSGLCVVASGVGEVADVAELTGRTSDCDTSVVGHVGDVRHCVVGAVGKNRGNERNGTVGIDETRVVVENVRSHRVVQVGDDASVDVALVIEDGRSGVGHQDAHESGDGGSPPAEDGSGEHASRDDRGGSESAAAVDLEVSLCLGPVDGAEVVGVGVDGAGGGAGGVVGRDRSNEGIVIGDGESLHDDDFLSRTVGDIRDIGCPGAVLVERTDFAEASSVGLHLEDEVVVSDIVGVVGVYSAVFGEVSRVEERGVGIQDGFLKVDELDIGLVAVLAGHDGVGTVGQVAESGHSVAARSGGLDRVLVDGVVVSGGGLGTGQRGVGSSVEAIHNGDVDGAGLEALVVSADSVVPRTDGAVSGVESDFTDGQVIIHPRVEDDIDVLVEELVGRVSDLDGGDPGGVDVSGDALDEEGAVAQEGLVCTDVLTVVGSVELDGVRHVVELLVVLQVVEAAFDGSGDILVLEAALVSADVAIGATGSFSEAVTTVGGSHGSSGTRVRGNSTVSSDGAVGHLVGVDQELRVGVDSRRADLEVSEDDSELVLSAVEHAIVCETAAVGQEVVSVVNSGLGCPTVGVEDEVTSNGSDGESHGARSGVAADGVGAVEARVVETAGVVIVAGSVGRGESGLSRGHLVQDSSRNLVETADIVVVSGAVVRADSISVSTTISEPSVFLGEEEDTETDEDEEDQEKTKDVTESDAFVGIGQVVSGVT